MNKLELLKKDFKEKLGILIEKKCFHEATDLVEEYRKFVTTDDTEVYSMQAVISLMQNNLYEAYKYIQDGLRINPGSGDLLYNLAQVYELRGDYKKASYYYNEAKGNVEDEDISTHIDFMISNLDNLKTLDSCSKTNDQPLISVLIPTYNMKNYLKEAVDSLLFQTYENIEIIVSDDCSTDGTDKMMLDYASNPKVKYYRNVKNIGAKRNGRKLLYEYATGKYVLGVNHDDYLIKANYISKAIEFLEKHPSVSLVFANLKVLKMTDGTFTYTNLNLPEITSGKDYFLGYETSEQYPHITSVLTSIYRREDAINSKILLEETESQDLFLYTKLMLVGDIGFISDCVGVYRYHDQSLSFNMPSTDDGSTIKELEILSERAVEEGFDQSQMSNWLHLRISNYVLWRFSSLWNSNRTEALKVLLRISETYPDVFLQITNRLGWIR
ncbi:glycosyltransferase family A protein [Paenibacillus sp. J22TS3]|uniref:glycosyltransferase family A protein n=1 Tax=Paenibacillus sp. J22TS3 TaxID=2807192 RepID=UPI001B108E1B|nr:glycosyltransferase family A protein [Paenibacillus sp. J22TS3]GIP21753.1 hypothetical protein J22TS3_20280 [Paenibacillus sp. J22TS3]